jgi:hypothetical protein
MYVCIYVAMGSQAPKPGRSTPKPGRRPLTEKGPRTSRFIPPTHARAPPSATHRVHDDDILASLLALDPLLGKEGVGVNTTMLYTLWC